MKCTQGWELNRINNCYCFIKNILQWKWLFFPLTNAWRWRVQWLLAQFGATALISAKTPAVLPTTAFVTTGQMLTQLLQENLEIQKSYSIVWILQHPLYFVARDSHKSDPLWWFAVLINRQIQAEQQPHHAGDPSICKAEVWFLEWDVNSVSLI